MIISTVYLRLEALGSLRCSLAIEILAIKRLAISWQAAFCTLTPALSQRRLCRKTPYCASGDGCHGHRSEWPCGETGDFSCPRRAVGMAPNVSATIFEAKLPKGAESTGDV